MSALQTKTPVSLLQEYSISQRIIPKYELVSSKVGTHSPEFTFRVQLGALWEEGTGKSKQEAKQLAAKKMLVSLKVMNDKEDEKYSEISDDFTGKTENYVGYLKEYCIIYRHPEPRFELEEMGGPPHNRTFKMVCYVSKLQEFGISRTKQLAKHQAALKMIKSLKLLEKPKTIKVENSSHNSDKTLNNVLVDASMTEKEISERFKALRTLNVIEVKDPVAFYKDHHKAYLDLVEMSPKLKELVSRKRIDVNVREVLTAVEKIAKELGVSLNSTEIPGKEKPLVLLTLCVTPSIAAGGINLPEAALKLLETLMTFCK